MFKSVAKSSIIFIVSAYSCFGQISSLESFQNRWHRYIDTELENAPVWSKSGWHFGNDISSPTIDSSLSELGAILWNKYNDQNAMNISDSCIPTIEAHYNWLVVNEAIKSDIKAQDACESLKAKYDAEELQKAISDANIYMNGLKVVEFLTKVRKEDQEAKNSVIKNDEKQVVVNEILEEDLILNAPQTLTLRNKITENVFIFQDIEKRFFTEFSCANQESCGAAIDFISLITYLPAGINFGFSDLFAQHAPNNDKVLEVIELLNFAPEREFSYIVKVSLEGNNAISGDEGVLFLENIEKLVSSKKAFKHYDKNQLLQEIKLIKSANFYMAKPLEEIEIIRYEVMTQPPVEVFHFDNKVSLDGMTSRSLNLNSKSYNGIKLRAPIDIKGNDAMEALASSLYAAFGADIKVSRGRMYK